jgi:hypothetical protein
MSHPTDPARPETSGSLQGTHHEFRRQGRAFGIEYDIGVRVLALSDPGVEAAEFADAIRAVSGELRLEPHIPVWLNHAAKRVDQLGRRVHGLGWVRDHEIGGCLTAAVGELCMARDQGESDRAESVRRAVLQLEAALAHADQGLRPQHP